VTLKSGLKVTKDHRNWYHLKAWCSFLFAFHSNYGAILYRLRDIATYWTKIGKFLYPTFIYRPRRVWPRRNFTKIFDALLIKLEWLRYRVVKKTMTYNRPILSRFHTMPERNGQTDRQTDGQTELLYQYRASVCWRAIKMIKNNTAANTSMNTINVCYIGGPDLYYFPQNLTRTHCKHRTLYSN